MGFFSTILISFIFGSIIMALFCNFICFGVGYEYRTKFERLCAYGAVVGTLFALLGVILMGGITLSRVVW